MLLDLSHTSHTGALTGIQRVARGLLQELGAGTLPVCYDPFARAWRPLEAWELARLAAGPSGRRRGTRWPWRARARGIFARIGSARPNRFDPTRSAGGLLEPEIFSPDVAAALPALRAAVPGPHAALFYDAVALKLPEMTPPKVVARYPSYLRELLVFDGIAAISADARDTLLEYWDWMGVTEHPPVTAITLGVEPRNSNLRKFAEEHREGSDKTSDAFSDLPDLPVQSDRIRAPDPVETVLSVGSIEGRKNHLALLEACESLWASGHKFTLRLIGAGRPETAAAALRRIGSLQSAGRPLRYNGVVDDGALATAYDECAFTVYPSLLEGFGLPVCESLVRGKPCICSGRGALGESARGGGCLALDSVDPGSLAAAIGRLLADQPARVRLGAEARARKFKSASDYAREVKDWMASLPPSRSQQKY